jgi:hypothetical protein
MKILYLTFALFSVQFAFGQSPNWTALKLFAGRGVDYGGSIYVDKKDNYYLTGTMFSGLFVGVDSLRDGCNAIFHPPVIGENGFLLRYDSNKILNLTVPFAPGTFGEVFADDAGTITVSGVFEYNTSRDGFVRKYSSTGNILWTKLLRSTISVREADDVITSLDVNTDGTMVIAGFSDGTQVSILGTIISGPINFIAKLDKDGNVQWVNSFSSVLGFGVYRVKFDKGGDIMIAGNEKNSGTNSADAIIGKISSASGALIWKKNFASSNVFIPAINAMDAYANKYVFGGVFGGQIKIKDSTFISNGNIDVVFLETDSTGNIIWVKSGGSPGRDRVNKLICDSVGNVYATGGYSDAFQFQSTLLSAKGYTDVYILSLNNSGSLRWLKSGGSNIAGHADDLFYDESGSGIAINSKKQIQIVGTTIGSGSFGSIFFNAPEAALQNAFWLTLSGKNNSETINYPCTNNTLDSSLYLSIYPNPFHELLNIKNSQNKILKYEIQLYNSLGQALYNKTESGAIITITDWERFSSGIYFLKIKVDNFHTTFKIVKH